ncbi:MAG TPA: tRNA (adenosine(37)-N6)-threonylcarbamoyltransferase complex ATPase subunit type 1 TsaE [Trueperaceae bacterium]
MDLPSPEATRSLARDILARSPAGSLVILAGPLGAGKTTLTKYLGELLGSPAHVSSPTYTLVHEYPSPQGLLVHIDAYRLGSAEALHDMGLEDYLERARLVVVEWGEALLDSYPDALVVRLELDANGRRATLFRAGLPLDDSAP